ncbi:hypothetical protein [Acinetobacter pragensis]|uniref:Uncharacterized protein n=1 Tax=Acinetobacter pragensis TaxID=1806892 RepID=A0A151Y5N4_9GAMM|nr:hypothetical protein [Acinetobacter pragensis]KYQ73306.1 hypothetical protein AZH43_06395 [Acinetobacter pragensis]
MWEIILKAIPFTPLLYWFFSKTFRMAKKRKFYEAQIRALDDYIKNYYNNDSIEFTLRDLKARQVTCNDWVGAKFLDYAISKKCPNIFGTIEDFDRAWFLVKLEDEAGVVKLVSNYSESSIRGCFKIIIRVYFFSGAILIINKSLLIFLSLFGLPGIPTYSCLYNFIFFISVLALGISSILIVSIGRGIASILALSKKLPINFKTN